MHKNRPKVAFVCVHNSCRSQLAEAIAKILAADVFEAYSAGTEKENEINPVAVEVIKELYAVDMNATQHVKLLEALPRIDILVTMGCNVTCPYLPCQHREDWGLEDPTGKSDEEFKKVIDEIRMQIFILKQRLDEFEEN